jgi:hypothetical protein
LSGENAGDLCQNRAQKLHYLENKLYVLANIGEGHEFLSQQEHYIFWMNESAAKFYNGLNNTLLWPNGCTTDDISKSISQNRCEPKLRTKKRTCISLNEFQKVVAFFGGIKRCRDIWVDPVCKKIVNEEKQQRFFDFLNETKYVYKSLEPKSRKNQSSLQLSNQQAQLAIRRLLEQIDLASNLYILYIIVTMLVSRPLAIFKRAIRSQITGVAFGLNKISFTFLVVIALSMHDLIAAVLRVTDLADLVAKLRLDPCLVDPDFGLARINMISETCAEVGRLQWLTSHQNQMLQEVYFRVKRFGLCSTGEDEFGHPKQQLFQTLTQNYTSGFFRNPASCNVSWIQSQTSTSLVAKDSAIKILMSSGILAQLTLKFVLSNLILHAAGFLEPLVLHSGLVEVWGDMKLSTMEKLAVKRFARDKHILPLVIYFLLFVLEIALLACPVLTKFENTSLYLHDEKYTPQLF